MTFLLIILYVIFVIVLAKFVGYANREAPDKKPRPTVFRPAVFTCPRCGYITNDPMHMELKGIETGNLCYKCFLDWHTKSFSMIEK